MQPAFRFTSAAAFVLIYTGLPGLLVPPMLPNIDPDSTQMAVGAVTTAIGVSLLGVIGIFMLCSHLGRM